MQLVSHMWFLSLLDDALIIKFKFYVIIITMNFNFGKGPICDLHTDLRFYTSPVTYVMNVEYNTIFYSTSQCRQ